MKILVTAFDAFGGESINPTEQVLNHLPGRIGRAEISQLVVPTKFGESLRRVTEAAEEESADAVVCLGQAGGRERITPERVAINVMDAEIPDNAGYQPVDVPVVDEGPAAYLSTLPVKAMVKAIGDIPARLSNTAGLQSVVVWSAAPFCRNGCAGGICARSLHQGAEQDR